MSIAYVSLKPVGPYARYAAVPLTRKGISAHDAMATNSRSLSDRIGIDLKTLLRVNTRHVQRME